MKNLRLSTELAYDWMVIAFLSRETFDKFFQVVLSRIGLLNLYGYFSAFVIFLPVLLVTMLSLKKLKACLPFIVLFVFLYFLFWVNLKIHPDYEQYYTRDTYGAYGVFFSLSRGAIWGAFVFTLARRARNVLTDIHIAAVLLLLYCLFRFYKASKVGYWEEYNDVGVLIKQSYNLVFGYKTMLCCIIFLFFFFEKRNLLDLIGGALSLFLVLKAGSRGPLICLVVFIVLWLFLKVKRLKLRYKITISVLLLGSYYLISRYYEKIVSFVLNVLAKLHISSRTVEMILSGNISDDNGRARIAELSWDAIAKQGFWGMGPFGCRTVIAPYYNYGYPHNIFLEFVLDYGWVLGILFLSVLLFMIIKVFRYRDKEQTGVLMILLTMCMKLMISGSYWSEPLFWGMMAWTVTCLSRNKRRKTDLIDLLKKDSIL